MFYCREKKGSPNFKARGILVFVTLVLAFVLLFPASHAFAEKSKLKIGVIGPMDYMQGRHHWMGAEMAAEEINATGGVYLDGKQYAIELVKADSNEMKSIPDAIGVMERLITSNEVDFVVGGFRSEAVLGMQDVASNYKNIFINVGSGHPQLTKRVNEDYDKYKYFFRLGSCNMELAEQIHLAALKMATDAVTRELGIQKPKVALLGEKLMWVDPTFELIKNHADELGIEVVGEWRPSYSSNDLTAEFTGIKNAGAQVIYDIASGPVAQTFSKQWGEMKIPAAAIGINVPAQDSEFWKKTNGNVAYEAAWSTFPPVPMTERTLPYIEKFKKINNTAPSVYSQTYEAVYILKKAIERAGGTLDADRVVRELENTDHVAAVGRIRFTDRDDKYTHDMRIEPGYVTTSFIQWLDEAQVCVWPPPGGEWKGVKYEGTEYYKLPPWVVAYWKDRE